MDLEAATVQIVTGHSTHQASIPLLTTEWDGSTPARTRLPTCMTVIGTICSAATAPRATQDRPDWGSVCPRLPEEPDSRRSAAPDATTPPVFGIIIEQPALVHAMAVTVRRSNRPRPKTRIPLIISSRIPRTPTSRQVHATLTGLRAVWPRHLVWTTTETDFTTAPTRPAPRRLSALLQAPWLLATKRLAQPLPPER